MMGSNGRAEPRKGPGAATNPAPYGLGSPNVNDYRNRLPQWMQNRLPM